MSARAEAEAVEFERVHEELIAACEAISDADWERSCPGEHWSIGAVAHHVAEGNRLRVERSAQPLGYISEEELAAFNKRSAAVLPRPDREETILVLREVADEALAQIAATGDDRLARRLTQHTRGHLESIQRALQKSPEEVKRKG